MSKTQKEDADESLPATRVPVHRNSLDRFIKNKITAATKDGRCPITEKMVEMFQRRALGANENEYEHLWLNFWGAQD